MSNEGDQAFTAKSNRERIIEPTYSGALSFLRRRYSRDLDDVDVVVSGIPFDNSVTYRPGCRLGPRAIRAASVQLAELNAFPYGFDRSRPCRLLIMVIVCWIHIIPSRSSPLSKHMRKALFAQVREC